MQNHYSAQKLLLLKKQIFYINYRKKNGLMAEMKIT